MMDSKPNVVYLVELHLPPAPAEAYEVLRYYIAKAVEELKPDESTRAPAISAHSPMPWKTGAVLPIPCPAITCSRS